MRPGVLNSAYATGGGLATLSNALRAVLSAEILYTAMPMLRFEQFAARRTELGTQPGQTIQIMKAGSIKRGGRLDEGRRMVGQRMSTSMQSITVWEHGNAIGVTEFLALTSFFDVFMMASILLGRDLALVLDTQLRDVAMSFTSVVYAGSASSRGTIASTDTLDVETVKDAAETLAVLLAPKWGGDHYVCAIHPHQGRDLRDDPAWINTQHYAYQGAGAQNPVYLGEIGRIEDVRFFETTMCPNGSSSATDPDTGEYVDPGYAPELDAAGASSTDVYKATMFGENSYGHAVGLDPEMRDDGVTDFGREHGVAWYGIWGSDILNDENGVTIETA